MLQQFLQSRFAVPAAIALIGLGLQFWPQLWALLAWAWQQRPTFAGTSTQSDEVKANPNYLDLDALERLDKRFERLECKAGQEAMKQVKQHFFTHKD